MFAAARAARRRRRRGRCAGQRRRHHVHLLRAAVEPPLRARVAGDGRRPPCRGRVDFIRRRTELNWNPTTPCSGLVAFRWTRDTARRPDPGLPRPQTEPRWRSSGPTPVCGSRSTASRTAAGPGTPPHGGAPPCAGDAPRPLGGVRGRRGPTRPTDGAPAFARALTGEQGLWTANPDGSAIERLTRNLHPPGRCPCDRAPAFSPDATHIAFAHTSRDGRTALFVVAGADRHRPAPAHRVGEPAGEPAQAGTSTATTKGTVRLPSREVWANAMCVRVRRERRGAVAGAAAGRVEVPGQPLDRAPSELRRPEALLAGPGAREGGAGERASRPRRPRRPPAAAARPRRGRLTEPPWGGGPGQPPFRTPWICLPHRNAGVGPRAPSAGSTRGGHPRVSRVQRKATRPLQGVVGFQFSSVRRRMKSTRPRHGGGGVPCTRARSGGCTAARRR